MTDTPMITPAKFCRRPTTATIEAMQWHPRSLMDGRMNVCAWIVQHTPNHTTHPHAGAGDSLRLFVNANDSWITVQPGQWIARDEHGFYPIHNDKFRESWQPVGDAQDQPTIIGGFMAAVDAEGTDAWISVYGHPVILPGLDLPDETTVLVPFGSDMEPFRVPFHHLRVIRAIGDFHGGYLDSETGLPLYAVDALADEHVCQRLTVPPAFEPKDHQG